jgi:hypothetical protein
LRLATTVGAPRLEAACARALQCDEPTHRTIKAILAQDLEAAPLAEGVVAPAHTFVRTAGDLLGHLFGSATWN